MSQADHTAANSDARKLTEEKQRNRATTPNGDAPSPEVVRVFDTVTAALSPDDFGRHLPNCGYTHELQQCGCADVGHRLLAGLKTVVPDLMAQAWNQGFNRAATSLTSAVAAGEHEELNPYRQDMGDRQS